MKRVSLLLSVFLLLAVISYGQVNSELFGVVVDQSGAVISGAKLVARNLATGLT